MLRDDREERAALLDDEEPLERAPPLGGKAASSFATGSSWCSRKTGTSASMTSLRSKPVVTRATLHRRLERTPGGDARGATDSAVESSGLGQIPPSRAHGGAARGHGCGVRLHGVAEARAGAAADCARHPSLLSGLPLHDEQGPDRLQPARRRRRLDHDRGRRGQGGAPPRNEPAETEGACRLPLERT